MERKVRDKIKNKYRKSNSDMVLAISLGAFIGFLLRVVL